MKTGNYIEDDDTDEGCNGELYRKRETIPKTRTRTKTQTQTRTQTKDKDAGRTLNIANCADQRGGDLLLFWGP